MRSVCFLQRSAERIALTGDGCTCLVLTLASGCGSAPAEVRRYALDSPGVAVRTHSREPQQLMVAQDGGHVHFLDLRVPSHRPSLSRFVPLDDGDAGGLIDADWAPRDPYLVGGVCGSRWLAWDLRQPGLAPLPHSGDAQPSACTHFRWSTSSERTSFATCGATGGAYVHHVQHADSGPSAWAAASTKLTHDLPTRVASLSWIHSHPAMPQMLVGCADTKVCIWALPSAAAATHERPAMLLA